MRIVCIFFAHFGRRPALRVFERSRRTRGA